VGDPVVHFEIGARDWWRAGAFYTEVFGWSVVGSPASYGVVDTGGVGIRAASCRRRPAARGGSPVYVAVQDVGKALVRAEELGGRRICPPRSAGPGQPSFAMLADPEGNRIGVFEKPA
jgi:predicted enzyme related to lactoylglutathione lyase